MNYQVIILFIVYMVFLVSLGYFRPEDKKSKYLIRKSIHFVTGLLIFILTFQISRQALLMLFIAGTIFSFTTYFIKRFNYIHVTGDSSWGTLFYPLGILISFIILYNLPIYYFQIALLFLAISDTIANIGGYFVPGNPKFRILTERKTPVGILGFTVTAFLIALFLFPGSDTATLPYILLAVICAIHFETISYKGSDNLTIPLGTALYFYLSHDKVFQTNWIIAVIISMAVVSVLLYRTGILTRYGSVGAHILGIYIFGILGLEWSVPVAFFFVSSVVFTWINGRKNRKLNIAGKRNIWQVMANISAGLVFSILYLISSEPIFIYFYISTLAAVTADTWASEIGPLFQKKCFSLAEWRLAPAGISGGISMAGTLAAFSGSFLLSVLAWEVFFEETDFKFIILVTLSGFLASFIDSLLGAFLEPHLNKMNFFKKRKGLESISPNDVVNLMASFSAPVFYLLLKLVFS